MRMLFMIYDADFDDDVMEMLAGCSVTGYTKWGRVLGKGKNSEPRMDDPVWPGCNCALAVVIEDELTEEIEKAAKELSSKLGGGGFAMFGLPVDRLI